MASILSSDYSRLVKISEHARMGKFVKAQHELRHMSDAGRGSGLSEIVNQLVHQNRIVDAFSLANGNFELYERIVTTLASEGRLPAEFSQALEGDESPKVYRAIALACASDAAVGPKQGQQLFRRLQSQIDATGHLRN